MPMMALKVVLVTSLTSASSLASSSLDSYLSFGGYGSFGIFAPLTLAAFITPSIAFFMKIITLVSSDRISSHQYQTRQKGQMMLFWRRWRLRYYSILFRIVINTMLTQVSPIAISVIYLFLFFIYLFFWIYILLRSSGYDLFSATIDINSSFEHHHDLKIAYYRLSFIHSDSRLKSGNSSFAELEYQSVDKLTLFFMCDWISITSISLVKFSNWIPTL